MKEQRQRHSSAAVALSRFISVCVPSREKRITCGHFVRSLRTAAEKLLDRFLLQRRKNFGFPFSEKLPQRLALNVPQRGAPGINCARDTSEAERLMAAAQKCIGSDRQTDGRETERQK